MTTYDNAPPPPDWTPPRAVETPEPKTPANVELGEN